MIAGKIVRHMATRTKVATFAILSSVVVLTKVIKLNKQLMRMSKYPSKKVM